jgi:predicted aldo/keto reductase-like oxidoreductase
MEHRSFGRLNRKVSALGFGCMRLPTLGKYNEMDEPAAIEMIRYAIDNGVNYLDSAHGYHGGHSERLIAKALDGGCRTPCPSGVAIPKNFQLLNHARVHGGSVAVLNRNLYAQMPKEKRADSCVACGKCEERCPQHIKIGDWLASVHAAMTER